MLIGNVLHGIAVAVQTKWCFAAILSLFLVNALRLSQGNATIIYHVFAMLCYFFPVIGAIIADSWLGKFK